MNLRKFRTVIMLIDTDGRQWVVHGPGGSVNKSVHLLEGVDGLSDATFDLITTSTARGRGDIFVGKTRGPREITLPFLIDGNNSVMRLSAVRRAFYESLTKGELTIASWTPTKGWRWLKGNVTSVDDGAGVDPYSSSTTSMINVTITCHEPLWSSYPQRDFEDISSNLVATHGPFTGGDVTTYPKLKLKGFRVGTEIGIGIHINGKPHGAEVKLPKTMMTNEEFWVDTDPAARTLWSSHRRALPWPAWSRTTSDKRLKIPPRAHNVTLRTWSFGGSHTATIFIPQIFELGF